MRGYLRKRTDRQDYWELVVEGQPDPVTGRRRQIRRGFKGSRKADAEKALRALVREVEEGRHRSSEETFGRLLDEWMAQARPGLSPTTLREYERLITKRIRPALGDVPLRRLDAKRIDGFYSGLRRELSEASVQRVHAIVRRALNQGILWDWVSANAALKATMNKVPKFEVRPPKPAEVRVLIAAAMEQDPEYGRFLHLVAATGMRRGEACAIRLADVDFTAGTLHISRSVVDVAGHPVEKDTKAHASRRVPIDGPTLELLRAQVGSIAARAESGAVTLIPNPYLFASSLDCAQPWRPDTVTLRFRHLRRKVGVSCRFHDLRHFHGSELVDRGIALPTVSRRLGHQKVSTTADIYTHPVDDTDRRAAGLMGELLKPEEDP
jgi:integrase